jgi:hypothetical protein
METAETHITNVSLLRIMLMHMPGSYYINVNVQLIFQNEMKFFKRIFGKFYELK